MTTDENAEDAFRWSLTLISKILIRTILEGSPHRDEDHQHQAGEGIDEDSLCCRTWTAGLGVAEHHSEHAVHFALLLVSHSVLCFLFQVPWRWCAL